MAGSFISHLRSELSQLQQTGLFKSERLIISPQSSKVSMVDGSSLLNFCSNNYLGLADNQELRGAAKAALDRYGYGMASVRFICGTQEEHQQLEARIANFLGVEDAILYSSCFDANSGLFETILSEEDAVISDALNHASIIDGIRLSKAQRFRYANNNMDALEDELKKAEACRFKLIVTDGVFSMDGTIANLNGICDLAEKYGAMVMVDDSHAMGLLGKSGRGSAEHCGVEGRVDIVTGTLGKALGGASGGYTAGKRELVSWLRQRSRPYLFSNTLMPAIAAASLKALDIVEKGDELREQLFANAKYFRSSMTEAGFELAGADHPIVPVMVGDAVLAQRLAERMVENGIFVTGFCFPVVPKGQARIRTQISAAHSVADIDRAVLAFTESSRELGIIS